MARLCIANFQVFSRIILGFTVTGFVLPKRKIYLRRFMISGSAIVAVLETLLAYKLNSIRETLLFLLAFRLS